MKLVIILIILIGVVVSILSYLDISIFNGIIASLFDGEIWEGVSSIFAEFGGFFTRILSNQYVVLILSVYIIFWVLRLFVDFLRSKKSTKNSNEKKESE